MSAVAPDSMTIKAQDVRPGMLARTLHGWREVIGVDPWPAGGVTERVTVRYVGGGHRFYAVDEPVSVQAEDHEF